MTGHCPLFALFSRFLCPPRKRAASVTGMVPLRITPFWERLPETGLGPTQPYEWRPRDNGGIPVSMTASVVGMSHRPVVRDVSPCHDHGHYPNQPRPEGMFDGVESERENYLCCLLHGSYQDAEPRFFFRGADQARHSFCMQSVFSLELGTHHSHDCVQGMYHL
ncbi:hypothetical protein BDP81DRAFT_174114 [Colletotrichum phormii]|uniref:Uncharacterized protein n=1 Tax=Colletotrichum phormii TaxID=359342 RepID=A0AAI9ZDS6_9PEZI|nr:uncharacterized protein BDP81DRAFT_174114 [Colletotrichum phormii]KAK1621579.1 hypothetical protein BDP81DRAFT_174114 [Colletotrichum phormii]